MTRVNTVWSDRSLWTVSRQIALGRNEVRSRQLSASWSKSYFSQCRSNVLQQHWVQDALRVADASLPHIKPNRTLPPRISSHRGVYSTSLHGGPPSSSKGGKKRESDNSSSHIWAKIFDDVDISVNAAMLPARRPIPVRSFSPVRQGPSKSSSTGSSSFPRQRSLTLREAKIFNELFEQIFEKRSTPAFKDPQSHTGIGLRPGEVHQSVDALFCKLRRKSKRYHDPTEAHLAVEQQRLIMESFNTDRELLDWAIEKVFNIDDPNSFPAKVPASGRLAQSRTTSHSTASPAAQSFHASSSITPDDNESTRQFAMQSSIYPHLLTSLIAHFRDKFHDPHTALSIFSAARHLSVPSYVFGCTSAVYNELLATLWTAFRDLEGIVEALNEMRTNGVIPDEQTRRIALRVKRDAMLLASGQFLDNRPSDSRPSSHPGHEMSSEQIWVDVPVDHPTRRLVAHMESLIAPPEATHPSSGSDAAGSGRWKKSSLPRRHDRPREGEDELEFR